MNLDGLKPDKNGIYSKNIGWKITATGNRSQPKFRVGKDKRTARKRLTKIALLWEAIQNAQHDDPIWDETALAVAHAIAEGDRTVRLRRLGGESPNDFADRVSDAQGRFPGVRFLIVEDEQMMKLKEIDDRLREELQGQIDERINKVEAEFESVLVEARKPKKRPTTVMPILGREDEAEPSLFEALDDYERQIKASYLEHVEGANGEQQLTPWGHQQVRNIGRLRERHHNMPISALTFDGCQTGGATSKTRPSCSPTRTMPRRKRRRWITRSLSGASEPRS